MPSLGIHNLVSTALARSFKLQRRCRWPAASSRIALVLQTLLVLSLLASSSAFATGPQLMISPLRVVMEDRERSAKIRVVNAGDKEGVFRISLQNKRMKYNGQLEVVQKAVPGERFVDNIVRFSPRQVILKPGQSQIVRLRVRRSSSMADGEYRSHMLFQSIKNELNNRDDFAANRKPGSIGVQITPVIGVTIPIIVRKGKTSASAELNKLTFHPATEKEKLAKVSIEMTRNGNQSVYGDFLVELLTKKGQKIVLTQVLGVAIYVPNEKRSVDIALAFPDGYALAGSSLNILFRESASKGGKLIAKSTLQLP